MSNQDYLQRVMAICTSLGIDTDHVRAKNLVMWNEPEVLVDAETRADGLVLQLTPEASHAWSVMRNAAGHDGVVLYLVSGYRSLERQHAIFKRKLADGVMLDAILQVNAPPGYSEHHSGRAIDIGTPDRKDLEQAFEDTRAFAWLNEHAPSHGFTLSFPPDNPFGYVYEPWHWLYTAG